MNNNETLPHADFQQVSMLVSDNFVFVTTFDTEREQHKRPQYIQERFIIQLFFFGNNIPFLTFRSK